MSDGHRYPRPLLRRAGWIPLDGPWDFALDREGRWIEPAQVKWNGTIRVPFAPETKASGIGETGFFQACWYRRTTSLPAPTEGERWLLHFAAVDYAATVWLNGQPVIHHQGGYTPFTVDATPHLGSGELEIVVRAEDDPLDLEKPRGKQDWQLEPHSIWYPRTSGIWQSVWLERVAATWVSSVRWTPNLERWELGLEVWFGGDIPKDAELKVELRSSGKLLGSDTYTLLSRECVRRIALPDPGVDDYRNELLWSPHSPTLIGARLVIQDASGKPVNHCQSSRSSAPEAASGAYCRVPLRNLARRTDGALVRMRVGRLESLRSFSVGDGFLRQAIPIPFALRGSIRHWIFS